jgi:hypothetical protein
MCVALPCEKSSGTLSLFFRSIFLPDSIQQRSQYFLENNLKYGVKSESAKKKKRRSLFDVYLIVHRRICGEENSN